jgi:tetratricopeptide (TPR) repeat protein
MGESPREIPCCEVVSGIRMRKYLSTAALVAALICTSLPLEAATPSEFYANLLRRGVAAYDGGRFDEAARSLRFAAFGYVDAIEPYQTAHAYLALALDRLGESDRARESVRRILTAERVERRFARLTLPAPVRSAFDKLASTVLTAPELAALRGTGELPPAPATQAPMRTTTTTTPSTNTATTRPSQQQPAQQAPVVSTTVTERTAPPVTVDRVEVEVTREPAATTQQPRNTTTTSPPAQQQPARTTPAPATQQPARNTTANNGSTTTQPRPTTPAPAQQQPARTTPAPMNQQPQQPRVTTTPRPTTYSATELATRFSSAERALVSANLNEARRIYREILASANGTDHATALRVAEGLYRARDFAGTLSAFERAGALRRGEEPYRYYQAVAFYETGQYDRARRELAAVLPYIEVTPDVERYRLKIQGGGQ